MPLYADDVVRLAEGDEPNAPIPMLLRGHYARVRVVSGESCSLVVYTWYGTVVLLDVPTRWLKKVPPDEVARFEFIKGHEGLLSRSTDLLSVLSEAKTTLSTHLGEVTGQNRGPNLWLYNSPFDVLAAVGKEQGDLSETQMTQLQNDWGAFVRAALLLHEAALRYTRS